MELNQFIEQTIFEISLGVQRAKIKSKDLAAVTPPSIDGQKIAEPSYVEFDVTLAASSTAEASKEGGGKAGANLRIAVVEASVGVDGRVSKLSTQADSRTHRVTFKVPVHFTAHYRNDPNMPAETAFMETNYGLSAK